MIHCPSRSVALSLHWDTETNSKAATPAYKHTLIQTYILCINWGRLDRNTLSVSLSLSHCLDPATPCLLLAFTSIIIFLNRNPFLSALRTVQSAMPFGSMQTSCPNEDNIGLSIWKISENQRAGYYLPGQHNVKANPHVSDGNSWSSVKCWTSQLNHISEKQFLMQPTNSLCNLPLRWNLSFFPHSTW